MDLSEVKGKKAVLEAAVRDALREFEISTGLRVSDLDIARLNTVGGADPVAYVRAGVKLP